MTIAKLPEDFIIICQKCGSVKTSIEHTEKFNMFYDDSYTENWVHLSCKECDNKKLIYSYNTY